MNILEILKSILQGIVQGITEWLPISSTGHMLLLDQFLHMTVSDDPVRNQAFFDLFKVVIQFGSILAVIVLYFHKLNPFSGKKSPLERKDTWKLWGKVLIASIPAGVIGIALAMAGDWCVKAAILLLRYKGGKWKTFRVLG